MESRKTLDKIKNIFNPAQRKTIVEYLFIVPFLIGFALLFLYPFIQAFIFSLSQLEVTRYGYQLNFVSLDNYHNALFVHPQYVRILVETIIETIVNTPLIIIFSFFIANILNQKFRGRLFFRLIFFLPLILASGALAVRAQIGEMSMLLEADSVGGETVFLLGSSLRDFFLQLQLPEAMIDYILDAVDQLPAIINSSAIPILIFLAGLQSISASLYEASNIEGATAWDNFWKITFPMVSPLFLPTIVYIFVDSFTAPGNEVMNIVLDGSRGSLGYGLGTAMALIYFFLIGIILFIAMKLVSRNVFYRE